MRISFQEDIQPYIKRLEEILGLSFKVFLLTSLVVSVLGIYVANLLFGTQSLQVLQNLKEESRVIELQISELKEENALLHKKYLEWTDAQ